MAEDRNGKSTVSKKDFSWSLAQAVKDFSVQSLTAEQVKCMRGLVCPCEDVLAVLPSGFGKSIICQIIPKVWLCLVLKSKETKSFVVRVVNLLQYTRKQVKRIKKLDCGLHAATTAVRDEMDKGIEDRHVNMCGHLWKC